MMHTVSSCGFYSKSQSMSEGHEILIVDKMVLFVLNLLSIMHLHIRDLHRAFAVYCTCDLCSFSIPSLSHHMTYAASITGIYHVYLIKHFHFSV